MLQLVLMPVSKYMSWFKSTLVSHKLSILLQKKDYNEVQYKPMDSFMMLLNISYDDYLNYGFINILGTLQDFHKHNQTKRKIMKLRDYKMIGVIYEIS